MKLKKVVVVYMRFSTREHYKTLKTLKKSFSEMGVKPKYIIRENMKHSHFRGKDLIIAVGGDGTFLRVAHHILDGSPILGVNSDVTRKEGFFMRTDRLNFANKLTQMQKGKYKIITFPRLQAKIGSKWTEPAINEIFFGHVKSYRMVRYDVKIRDKREFQKSSGFILCTPAGSHAWLKAAGGNYMNLSSSRLQYVTREPHHGTLTKQKLNHGYINKNETVTIIPKTRSGVVVADSLSKEYFTKVDTPVVIKVSDITLNMISF